MKHGSKKINKNSLMICLVLLITVVLCIGFTVISKNQKDVEQEENEENSQLVQETDYEKINLSDNINKDREVRGILLSEIKLAYEKESDMTIFRANLENITDDDSKIIFIDIVLLDKEQNEIVTISGIINSIQSREFDILSAGVNGDYSEAYDLKINVK